MFSVVRACLWNLLHVFERELREGGQDLFWMVQTDGGAAK